MHDPDVHRPAIRPVAKTATRSYQVNYAGLCGWALARAHARSGDRVQIATYLGKSECVDVMISDFAVADAVACADQHEQDHAGLCAAVKAGRVETDADT